MRRSNGPALLALLPRPMLRFSPMGAGHLREGRGNRGSFPAAPSPRLLPRRPKVSPNPMAATPQALPRGSRGPPTAEAWVGLPQRRLGWSRPGPGCGPSGFPEARRAGGTTSAQSRRRVPGIPAPQRELPRLRGGRGESASSGGGEGCSRGATTGAPSLEPGTPIPAELTTRLGARGLWSLPTPRRDDRRCCRRSGVAQLGDSWRGGRGGSLPT